MTFSGERRILHLWLNAQNIALPRYLSTHNPRGSCKYLETWSQWFLCVFNTVKLYGLAINHLIGSLSSWKQVLIKFLQIRSLIINMVDFIISYNHIGLLNELNTVRWHNKQRNTEITALEYLWPWKQVAL